MPRTAEDIQFELAQALNEFDWPTADDRAEEMRLLALRDPSLLTTRVTKDALNILRKKRRFRSMGLLAQAFVYAGFDDAQIKRQMAQALIDQGDFYAAEMALESILLNTATSQREKNEAQGLLGRLYKQLYVSACGTTCSTKQAETYLRKAMERYYVAYEADPVNNYWHGINAVAIGARAKRDRVTLPGDIDHLAIAGEIRARLEEAEELDIWQRATLMESYVALGDTQAAFNAAKSYVSTLNADAFEVGGTLRQMREVWQITDDSDIGKLLLPLLSAVMLKSPDGGLRITPQQAKATAKDTDLVLQAVHGTDRFKSVKWYRDGLERCKSVALVRRRGGDGFGTGWLVDAAQFFPGETGQMVLTNAHVVGQQGVLQAGEAEVTFDMVDNKPIEVDSVFRWSPINEFDAAFLKLKTPPPGISSMPVAEKSVTYKEAEPARLYVIGHPGGGELAFSLQDNRLLGCNEVKVHYRTPTIGGSSGSPVFEETDWQVVALHHGGGTLARLDDEKSTYGANEGISIHAIRRAAQGGRLS